MTAQLDKRLTQPSASAARGFFALALALILGIGAVAIGVAFGGSFNQSLIGGSSESVQWVQAISKYVSQLASAISIGTLVLAAFALSDKSPALARALRLSAAAAAVWTIAALTNFLFTFLSVSGSALSFDNGFGQSLWLFATDIELGIALAIHLLMAAALTVLTVAFSSLTATAFMAAIGLASLIPLALISHSAGTAGHALAVNALGLHLVAIVIWVGGLAALGFLRSKFGSEGNSKELQFQNVVSRYSTLALASFVLVAISGVASAIVRIEEPSQLISGYGAILGGKIIALVVLGIFGAAHRLRILPKFETSAAGSAFFRLAAVELGIMGIAIGLATALARTPIPVIQKEFVPPTPAELLTGEKLPPEFTWVSLFTTWKIDLLWMVVAAAGILAYLEGVRRLRARGDSWSWSRTASWVTGMLLLFYVTGGALNAYQEYLFSIHMVAHMMLTMAVPVFLVPGAPVTLLMRAVAKRQDGSRGLREWVLWAVHTRYARFVAHPIVAAVLFASSLVVFYFTPLFAWSTSDHLGHQWMVLHFTITGYLFVQSMIGIDPGPTRMNYPIRLVLLIGTMAFHAFFGLAIMGSSGLLLPEWYGAMGRTWGDAPLVDQENGGAIAWGIGELPTAALTVIVSVQWYLADRRDSRRLDRASDRSGNQDLHEYNEMLSKLAAREQKARR